MKKDISIQILHLSKRSYNALKSLNINTVQELLVFSIENIKKIY